MNIVIIPAFFATKKRPTLGSFFWDQAQALQKEGHSVTILYCDTYSVKMMLDYLDYQEEEKMVIGEIKIFRKRIFCPVKHGIAGYREQFAHAILNLYHKYMESEKIDVIHAHCCVWAGAAAYEIWKQYRIPYVITEHATLFKLHKDTISVKDSKIIKEYYEQASKVICVSKEFKQQLSEYRKDIEVIGNIVDCERFHPLYCEKTNDIFIFFSLCYMDTEAQLHKKGMDILVQAYAEIHKEFPDISLIIGGGGKAEKTLKEWFNKYSDGCNVTFLGNLSRDEVIKQMQQTDCFVLPSRYETFGVVYIEAMACGKPVIGVKNGGPDEFVNQENGLLIESENVDELIRAMRYMVKNRTRFQSEQIAADVSREYSSTAIVKKLELIYKSIIL